MAFLDGFKDDISAVVAQPAKQAVVISCVALALAALALVIVVAKASK